MCSYSGNCISAKGTSRKSVMPYPRYNPPNGELLVFWDRTCRNVCKKDAVDDDEEELVADTCIFCLITSVGTRT